MPCGQGENSDQGQLPGHFGPYSPLTLFSVTLESKHSYRKDAAHSEECKQLIK